MKNNIAKKWIKKWICSAVAAAALMAAAVPVYALDDGAYTVGRTTSYANPETGKTVDGGTNIALGDSMCAGIVEETALVEQSWGKTYVTLGFGLMSNISNVAVQVQDTDGTYKEVEITKTGSCERDGDRCDHYRFEVVSPDLYISPKLFVDPMGREVQFFVKLDMASASAGTGNFVSEMVKPAGKTETADTDQAAKINETEEQKQEQPETETQEQEDKDTAQKQEEKKEKNKNTVWPAFGAAVAVVAAAGIGLFVKKRK